jgi:hypothetical protein
MAEVAAYSAATSATRQDVSSYGSDAGVSPNIGNRGGSDRTFDGRIAHVMIWNNRVQLKDLEYLRTRPSRAPQVKFSTAGGTAIALMAYWPLNGSDGDTAFDHSGNGSTASGAQVTNCALAEGPPYH